jgi:hypothetical protein
LVDRAQAQPDVTARLSAQLSNWRQSLPPPRWPLHTTTQVRMCTKETEWVY